MKHCFECLDPIFPGESFVMALTNEEGTIHNVVYPKGSRVFAHQRCIEVVE